MFSATLHFVLIAAALIVVFATLPLLVELLVLSLAAAIPRRRRTASVGRPFRLAVVIPAHNEELLIEQCVGSVLSADDLDVAVFVVAHNCEDSTAELARAAGAEGLVLNDDVGGKGVALDYGFRHALASGAEGVLVVDADSIVSPNLISEVIAAFIRGAGAVQCRYQVLNADTNRRIGIASLALLGMNVLRPRGRARLGLSCGIFGNGFALSAETLMRVPYTANSLVEDLEYHLHLMGAGIRVEFLDNTAVFGEMPGNAAAATTQRARWEGGRILMRRLWTQPLLQRILRGEWRMLEPLLDLRALPLALQVALLIVALAASILGHLAWLTTYAALGSFAILLYLIVAACLSPDPLQTLQALATAPAYVAWKIALIPRTRLTARTGAAWVRTQRNAESVEPPQDQR